jgi:transcription elongation factor GreA
VYSIVGDHEGDIKEGRIAISAPLARALIGREQGDTVSLRTNKGSREYQIQQVTFVPVDEA